MEFYTSNIVWITAIVLQPLHVVLLSDHYFNVAPCLINIYLLLGKIQGAVLNPKQNISPAESNKG